MNCYPKSSKNSQIWSFVDIPRFFLIKICRHLSTTGKMVAITLPIRTNSTKCYSTLMTMSLKKLRVWIYQRSNLPFIYRRLKQDMRQEIPWPLGRSIAFLCLSPPQQYYVECRKLEASWCPEFPQPSNSCISPTKTFRRRLRHPNSRYWRILKVFQII